MSCIWHQKSHLLKHKDPKEYSRLYIIILNNTQVIYNKWIEPSSIACDLKPYPKITKHDHPNHLLWPIHQKDCICNNALRVANSTFRATSRLWAWIQSFTAGSTIMSHLPTKLTLKGCVASFKFVLGWRLIFPPSPLRWPTRTLRVNLFKPTSLFHL